MSSPQHVIPGCGSSCPKRFDTSARIGGFSMGSPIVNCTRSSTRTRRRGFSGCTGCSSKATWQADQNCTIRTIRHATQRLAAWTSTVDTWIAGKGDALTKGSDLEHILALVRSRGYAMPADMMSVRLVHLLDKQKRKELMIVYSEDLAMTGLAADQLREAGSARARRSAIERNLIARGVWHG